VNYTHLGRAGLQVSRIALGAMNFGELTEESTRFGTHTPIGFIGNGRMLAHSSPWVSREERPFS
jgi:hypothetical protein